MCVYPSIYLLVDREREKKRRVLVLYIYIYMYISSTNYPHLPMKFFFRLFDPCLLYSHMRSSHTSGCYILIGENLLVPLDNQQEKFHNVEKNSSSSPSSTMTETTLPTTNPANVRFLFLTANTGSIFEKVKSLSLFVHQCPDCLSFF